MTMRGYKRADGLVGIRNHVIVLPTSVCASETAIRIAAGVSGTVALPHTHGCCQMGNDKRQTVNTLVGLGANPNVAAVLVVTLGCEGVEAKDVVAGIESSRKPVQVVGIQDCGGTTATVERGTAALRRLFEAAACCEKAPIDLADIILGMECGGSDATSGLVANPVLGVVSDRIVEAGGTSILSETTELIGAEHILARRARDDKVADDILRIVKQTEDRAKSMGEDIRGSQPTPGNIEGGITTIEEKSLGCIYKAGSAPIEGVIEYAERPPGKGLYVMDTPGQDIESITGMVAGGAQVLLFTTGRGTPTGCPIAPVIKITGNGATYRNMEENIDINAGEVIDSGVSIEEMAGCALGELVEVCNGKQTKAETSGHREFGIHRVGFTF